jgi:hypothetical protein
VPLSTLQTELQNYLATLKSKVRAEVVLRRCSPFFHAKTFCFLGFTQMVEVINEDYSDYVSLSSRLTSVDGAVLRMRKPLLELKVCYKAVMLFRNTDTVSRQIPPC